MKSVCEDEADLTA